jgi:hypothetical protein
VVPVNWLALNQIDWMVSPIKANSEGIVPTRLLPAKAISCKDPVIGSQSICSHSRIEALGNHPLALVQSSPLVE